MFSRILVPTDGTERTAAALATALRLARLGGGCVIGVHATGATVLDIEAGAPPDADQNAQDALAYVNRRAHEAAVPCDALVAHGGPAADAIIRAARDHMCDLIVMTMRGRRGLAGRLGTGTTQRVLNHSAIPVLVVRGGA
jgi:nucleotide-binding universal stress UspA family protein